MKFSSQEIFTISNGISLLRLLLVIPLWFLLDHYELQSVRYITFALCLFAAATDILDGYLARKLNQITELGKIIDPLADKAAMAVVVIKLFLIGEINLFFFLTIFLRDILIFFGGLIVTKILGTVLPSNILGKITVLCIGMVVLLILLGIDRNSLIFTLFYFSSIVLMFISFLAYVYRAVEFIKKKKNESV
ncbi:MAG: CDP-alcohol phosphatidyltransferase family protein [Ignavibacterium sp.]|jgi:CDP-diacylglycerol--glycerol-3-phosphate 3-phosphatidyltransferase|nr:CDP-alcohol phosphatidyltransferase family protein [Ignavibacterium sp.]